MSFDPFDTYNIITLLVTLPSTYVVYFMSLCVEAILEHRADLWCKSVGVDQTCKLKPY